MIILRNKRYCVSDSGERGEGRKRSKKLTESAHFNPLRKLESTLVGKQLNILNYSLIIKESQILEGVVVYLLGYTERFVYFHEIKNNSLQNSSSNLSDFNIRKLIQAHSGEIWY